MFARKGEVWHYPSRQGQMTSQMESSFEAARGERRRRRSAVRRVPPRAVGLTAGAGIGITPKVCTAIPAPVYLLRT